MTLKEARQFSPFPIRVPQGWSGQNDISRVLINDPGGPNFEVGLLFEDDSRLLYVTRDRPIHLEPIHGGPGTDSYIIDLNGIRALVREPGQKEVTPGDSSSGVTKYPGIVNWYEGSVEVILWSDRPAQELIAVARTIAGSA